MLKCEEVRARLPAQLTGEPSDADVRGHMAGCTACRDERARLRATLDRARDELAALAPTPFLEDAVLESVTAERANASEMPHFHPRWTYVGVAAAALLLLFLFVRPWSSTDEPGGPSAPGADETTAAGASIHVPPSAWEVERARRRNEARLPNWPERGHWRWKPGEEHVMFHQPARSDEGADGALTSTTSDAFLPPDARAEHRYVYGDVAAMPYPVGPFETDGPPRGGVMILGQAFLDRLGAEMQRRAGVDLVLGDRRWRTTAGTAEGELFVGSPDEGGAEARVRVEIRPGYDGTLLLDEPLARALGLHQFEIPGRPTLRHTVTGSSSSLLRARARVRMPELGFSEVVEIQVRAAWSLIALGPGVARPLEVGPDQLGKITGLGTITVEAEPAYLPVDVLTGRRIEIGPDGAVLRDGVRAYSAGDVVTREVAVLSPPPTKLVLGLRSGSKALPEPVWIVADAFDEGRELEIVPLTFGHRLPVGADVVIAPVWRGSTAHPSRTAVVRTKVAADGRVHAARVRGETVSTLRMLVTPSDGESFFRDAIVRGDLLPNPRHLMHVTSEGIVHIGGESLRLFEGTAWKGVEELPRLLSKALQPGPAKRDPDGTLRDVLDLRVEEGTPWRVIQAILQAGAHPDIGLRKIQLGLVKDDQLWKGYIPYELPMDRGIQPDEAADDPDAAKRKARLVVTLRRMRPEDPLTVRLQRLPDGSEMRWEPESLEIPIPDAVKAILGKATDVQGEVRVPPPGHVSWEEVFDVLDALRTAHVDDVIFEGAPVGPGFPIPRVPQK